MKSKTDNEAQTRIKSHGSKKAHQNWTCGQGKYQPFFLKKMIGVKLNVLEHKKILFSSNNFRNSKNSISIFLKDSNRASKTLLKK